MPPAAQLAEGRGLTPMAPSDNETLHSRNAAHQSGVFKNGSLSESGPSYNATSSFM